MLGRPSGARGARGSVSGGGGGGRMPDHRGSRVASHPQLLEVLDLTGEDKGRGSAGQGTARTRGIASACSPSPTPR